MLYQWGSCRRNVKIAKQIAAANQEGDKQGLTTERQRDIINEVYIKKTYDRKGK